MQTKPIIQIQNVVASIDTNQEINLNEISEKFPDSEYGAQKIFAGLIFRTKNPLPKTVMLIFSSGKMVSTGAKSEKLSRIAIKSVMDDLISEKIITRKKIEIIIQNMVATVNLGGKIPLEKAARTLPRCMYEPDQFPAVIYRVPNPKSVHMIFSTGKVVCIGAKTVDDLTRSVNNLHSDLETKKLINYE